MFHLHLLNIYVIRTVLYLRDTFIFNEQDGDFGLNMCVCVCVLVITSRYQHPGDQSQRKKQCLTIS